MNFYFSKICKSHIHYLTKTGSLCFLWREFLGETVARSFLFLAPDFAGLGLGEMLLFQAADGLEGYAREDFVFLSDFFDRHQGVDTVLQENKNLLAITRIIIHALTIRVTFCAA